MSLTKTLAKALDAAAVELKAAGGVIETLAGLATTPGLAAETRKLATQLKGHAVHYETIAHKAREIAE